MNKTLLVILSACMILSAGCIGQQKGCRLPGDCEGRSHANCSSDWLCIDNKCVWGCGECTLSSCDCKCYLKGESPEEKTGKLCGINCLGEFNVSGCEYRNGRCVGLYREAETECTRDSDCGTGGCSGQVCGLKDKVKDIITTCEYRPEYGCLNLTSCKCLEGKCQWGDNTLYRECLEKSGNETGLVNPASVYCIEQGYRRETREDENGGQYGVCISRNNTECEEWAFYRGDCNLTEIKDRYYCETAGDCIPEQCCHPTSCVGRDYAPKCAGIMCTRECREGTLDCGAGACDCKDNKCTVTWTGNETLQ